MFHGFRFSTEVFWFMEVRARRFLFHHPFTPTGRNATEMFITKELRHFSAKKKPQI
jgi:hypothetical protein